MRTGQLHFLHLEVVHYRHKPYYIYFFFLKLTFYCRFRPPQLHEISPVNNMHTYQMTMCHINPIVLLKHIYIYIIQIYITLFGKKQNLKWTLEQIGNKNTIKWLFNCGSNTRDIYSTDHVIRLSQQPSNVCRFHVCVH